MKKILVKWHDSYTNNRWTDKQIAVKEFKKPMTITSCGMLMHKDKKSVILCHSFDGVNTNGILHIPKDTIVKITELK